MNKTMPSSLNKNNECGYLEIFIGPMFSGKTSKLIDLYKQYSFCNIPLAVINHSSDTRYDDTMLSTHDKIMIPCIQTSTLTSVTNDMDNVDVILINEGQFFEDLYDFVVDMLKFNKKIYVSGLDGDFKREKFGKILDLIPLCDKVTKMTSLCSLCKNGTPGLFSMRLTNEKQQMLIGSSNYIPVCRFCYEENEQNE
uniref:thymidine kinase n=1 Tax=viral metagenome TaxID=1070528 RepID=A0A6C0DEI8_9ZZZZ